MNEVQDKMLKKANVCITIRIGCLIAGVVSALILWHVFKDALPEGLVEAFSFRRGSRNGLAAISCGAGLFVGEIISKILIQIMKLEDEGELL